MSRRAAKYHTFTDDVCNEMVRNSTDAVGAKLPGLPPQHSQKQLYSLQFRYSPAVALDSERYVPAFRPSSHGETESISYPNTLR